MIVDEEAIQPFQTEFFSMIFASNVLKKFVSDLPKSGQIYQMVYDT